MSVKTLTYVLMGKDQLSSVTSKAGKNVESHGKMIGTAMAGAAVAIAGSLIPALMSSVDAANHSNKVADQTAAVLKSTGNAAHITSDAIGTLAGSIMKKTGIDDEAVRTGANMLLTFTNIRNEAGKGNQIFDQTTQAVTDMAAAMNGGNVTEENMRSTSILVGKALNDPIKGLSALGRVGVSFTAQQKEQIKAMVASGDRMGAQKIILGELRKEYAGSAEKAATPFKKLKATMGELQETIGNQLLPVALNLTKWALGIFQRFSALPGPVQKIIVSLAGIVAIGVPMIMMFNKVSAAMKAFGIASKIAALGNPWVLLGIAIAALVVLIIMNWSKIARVTAQVWGAIRNFVVGVWHAIYNTTMSILNSVVSFVKRGFSMITGAVAAALNWIKQHWPLLLAILTGPIGMAALIIIRHWSNIKNAASTAFNAVVGFFRSLPGRILSAIGNVGKLLTGIGGNLISGMYNGITGALGNAASWVKTHIFDKIVGAIKGLFGIHSPSTVMAGIGGNIMQGVFSGILAKSPKQFVTKVFGGLPAALGALVGKGIVNLAKLPAKALHALGSLGGKIGGFFGKLFGGGGGGAGVQRWAGLVLQVLSMFGQPASLLQTVLRRMNQESGGNPRAINLWDSNAKAGIPSMGLMQTIGPTFNAYAGPFRNRGVYDPLANIYASFAYAIANYGSLAAAFNRAGGYALGTRSAKRGWAWVGERGRELMHFNGGESVTPGNRVGIAGGSTLVWTGDVVIRGHALATKQEIGAVVSDALEAFGRKGGRTR